MIDISKKTNKSVKLTAEELSRLTELRKAANSDTDFAISLSMDRVTLVRIITLGSGSQLSIQKIRRKLSRIARPGPKS